MSFIKAFPTPLNQVSRENTEMEFKGGRGGGRRGKRGKREEEEGRRRW